jgi:hypothetical protein
MHPLKPRGVSLGYYGKSMRNITPLLLIAFACSAQESPVHREAIEWTDVWMPNTNSHDLPRVMLIGDSITRAYFPAVEENLKGKAYVARIATSKAIGDPALIEEIGVFLRQGHFDVIHFNVGMHGWGYTETEYRQYFPSLVAAIRKNAPGARLVWANTTPVRKDREGGATNSRIDERNRIVGDLAAKENISLDDLHALMKEHTDLHSDDVHFNKEGNSLMAAQVVREVTKLLPAAR